MDLRKVRNIVLTEMNNHGLSDWNFRWLNDEVGRYGFCDVKMKTICLSRLMTKHDTDMDRVNNTILHEIAHALDYEKRGFTKHDSHWRKIALSIGCNGQKFGSIKGLKMDEIYKWKATCYKCDNKFFKDKRPKIKYMCNTCKSILDYKFNEKASGKY
jgi:predicted SprT family Zn-dependent metalloprotease